MQIYTLGTSNRSLEDFLEILNFYQIKVVVDVRRFPTSKKFPHFQKNILKNSLETQGIMYFHLEDLGGYRKEGYERYTKTERFKSALSFLIELAKNKITCIVCAEKFPWKCHRRFIAKALEDKGIKVLHIIEKNKIWQPETPLFMPNFKINTD